MLTLKKKILDSPIQTIDGRSAVEADGSIITFRKAFVSCCGIFLPQRDQMGMPQSPAQLGEEAIKAYDLGLKIHRAKEDINLENSEAELLKKIVNMNRFYVAFITAQLYKLLQEIVENPKKVEEQKEGIKGRKLKIKR